LTAGVKRRLLGALSRGFLKEGCRESVTFWRVQEELASGGAFGRKGSGHRKETETGGHRRRTSDEKRRK
jgi:hypothetical protein